MTSVAEIICRICGETKPETDYYRSPSNRGGRQYQCKVCVVVYQRDRVKKLREADPEGFARTNKSRLLRHVYRITLEQYESLLENQGGVCAICKKDTDAEFFCVDHDHSCCPGRRSCGKCVRGLLCRPCNSMLGQAEDSPETLEEAARYLRTASSEGDQ